MNHTLRRCLGVAAIAAISAPWAGAIAQEEESFLEEIVVVSKIRGEQNLQSEPTAITAYTGEMLQESAIKDIRDLATIVPTLTASQSQTSTTTSYAIRGIGTSSQNFGLESSVGIYIDGVYRARQSSIINNLVDMEAVEILRGPQGTLFGKNTPSGALNIRTVAPSHEQDGFFEATMGNFGLANFSGAMNFSLIEDVLAMRVTGFSGKRDGFVDDITLGDDAVNDRDRHGGRLQFLYTPSDTIDARLIYDFSEIDEVCCATLTRLNNFEDFDGNPGTDAALRFLLGFPVITADRFEDNVQTNTVLPRSTNDDNGVSLEVNVDFDSGTLTSITSSRNFDSTDDIDIDFNLIDALYRRNDARQSAFTQELQFAGEFGEGNNYVIGAYYFQQDLVNDARTRAGSDANDLLSADPTLAGLIGGLDGLSVATGGLLPLSAAPFPGGAFALNESIQEHESVAIFAQADYAISDQWILTVGGRYTEERKELIKNFSNSPLGPAPDFAAAVGTLTGIGIWQVNPAAPGAIDPTNPANLPTILGAFSPFYVPGWGAYTQPELAPQASTFDRLDDDQVTGTIKLSYMPNDDMLFYASFGTGFKSGGTNVDRIPSFFDTIFLAETSEAMEIGMKATFPDQNLRLNVALHDTQVEDLQTSAFSGNGFNLQNAGNADTHGVEIEASWRPTQDLEVDLSYAYNVADFEDFPNGTCWVAWPFQTGEADPGLVNPADEICDRSGDRIPSNPEHSAFLSVQQNFDLSSSVGGFARVEYQHLGETMTDGNNDPFKLRPAFDFVNLRAGLFFDDWNADASVWVRNLSDERFYETVFDVPLQAGKQNAYPWEPRTWGVTFRKFFD